MAAPATARSPVWARSPKQQRRVLTQLRLLRDAIVEEFQVSHSLYAKQITPCDFQHFIKDALNSDASGAFRDYKKGLVSWSSVAISWL